MNTKIILKTATIIAFFLYSTFSYSQGCHGGGGNMGNMNNTATPDNPNKYALNGGVIKKVGKYNIEMVYEPMLTQDPLVFYLMNKKGKPISDLGIVGKAEITYSDKSVETITLEPRGENGFAGQMLNKTGSFICFLTLQINGDNITARFDGGNIGKETAAGGYTCSMCGGSYDKPGSCPKCGMALVKKSDASGMKMKCGMMGGMSDMNKSDNKEKNNSVSDSTTQTKVGGQAVKDSVIYTCSMHPDVKLDKPGKCPKCGMTLIKAERAKYACTMKCEGDKTYDKPGICPKCGMDFKKIN